MASTAHSAQVHGTAEVDLIVADKYYYHFRFGVINELCADVILGLDFIKMHKEVQFNLHGPNKPLRIDTGSATTSEACLVMAAKVEQPRIFRSLEKNCKPIATKSRKYSQADQDFIKEEICKLLEEGIIEPSNSPWRTQVLITKDERHKKRMVVDYSQIVNRFTQLDAYPLPRIDDQINSIAQCEIYSTLDLKSTYYQIPLMPEDRKYTAFEANNRLYH